MLRRIDLAFGSGQFVCVGRAIAYIEIYKTLAEVSTTICPASVQRMQAWRTDGAGLTRCS
jgi:cytochrome P450